MPPLKPVEILATRAPFPTTPSRHAMAPRAESRATPGITIALGSARTTRRPIPAALRAPRAQHPQTASPPATARLVVLPAMLAITLAMVPARAMRRPTVVAVAARRARLRTTLPPPAMGPPAASTATLDIMSAATRAWRTPLLQGAGHHALPVPSLPMRWRRAMGPHAGISA